MPGMKLVGMNTPHSTSAIAINAPDTSSIVLCAASRGESPSSSIKRSIFSTTTIASSTTIPIASTMPNSERLLRLKPKPASTARLPISDTGIAMIGINAARQLCRNSSTTKATRISASTSVCSTASIEAEMYSVGLYGIEYFSPGGKLFEARSISSLTACAVLSAFDPGSCVMPIAVIGLPFSRALIV